MNIHKLSRTKKENAVLIILGVDDGKSTIISRLKEIKQPGEGYFHFPLQKNKGYDRQYFRGLISEKKVLRKRAGQFVKVWEKINDKQQNEPLELRNYAYAALKLLNPNFEKLENRLRRDKGVSKPVNSKRRRGRGVASRGVQV